MKSKLIATALLFVALLVSRAHAESDRCEFLHIDKAVEFYKSEVSKEEQRIIWLNKDYTYAVVGAIGKSLKLGEVKVTNTRIASGILFFYGRNKQFMFMTLDKHGNMCGMVTYHYAVFQKFIEPLLGEPI